MIEFGLRSFFVQGYLVVGDYEDGFLTGKEQVFKNKCDKCLTKFFCQDILGNLNTASAAMYGMKDSSSFAKVFLDHPVFGER